MSPNTFVLCIPSHKCFFFYGLYLSICICTIFIHGLMFHCRKTLNFENLPQHISQLLSTGLESSQSQRDGRLGPSRVVMDRSNGFEGLLIVDEDLLGVIGHSNFSSIRSSTCVYKGRWMYEVMLSSQGLMQIGWCTLECRFNQEEGVGDTPNSYAYDGSRVRKWNVTTTNYGKPWAAGDIVTCLLDLDEGTCSFFLNGVALGTAFSDVRLGSKMAYFPAVSLSFRENVVFNFGGRPLRYPLHEDSFSFSLQRYQPLQDPPFADLLQAQKLMGYLKSVRSVPVRGDVNVFLAISHIFAHLTPLLVKYLQYWLQYTWFFLKTAFKYICVLQDFEVENSLKQLMMSLLREFRFSPLSPDMGEQVCHLQLLLVILQHDKSRRFLLNSVLYPPCYSFFNVKLPVRVDEAGLEQMIPVTWWGKQSPTVLCPPEYLLCFLHRLTRTLREIWLDGATAMPEHMPLEDAYVPPQVFYNEGLSYFELQRLGGLIKHLRKIHKGVQLFFLLLKPIIHDYFLMVGVAEDVKEYALALTETEAKISRCPLEQCDVMKELQRSENVFRDKLNQLSRRLAWHNAAIYSSEKMGDIYWLLRIALGSVEHADRSGPFFAFLPEFYVSVSVNAYNALKSYFTGVETLPGFEGTLIRLATVLARHFVDPRIVGTDIKDLLMQALASFVCFPSSLHALEEVPDSIRMSMLRSLLAPYEQRPWAQTNWILVRLWKGSGFGYRYTHLIPPLRLKPSDANNPTLQKPCPSLRLQQQAATLLQQRSKQASAFLNSLINQLNWAFSEFVGMIQEIQQTAERPERNIVDSRQLKVCATCFDLSVSLLRVLEMTAHLVPSTLSDPTSPASDLLLARLSQLLNQILHRITAEGGLFDRMVSFRLPVLEQVDHYPILAAVTGTLIQLIVLGTPECRERATAALLADPGFQLRCICCLLGEGDGARKDPTNVGASTRFSFRKRESWDPSYVNAEELQMVEQLVSHLSVESTHAAASTPTSEEDLCPICCAHCISAVFQPCGHKSCKTCIQQHLMNNKECFFCKTVISTVNDFTVPPSS
uniref:E3 ubiquitin-protein ligase RNF123 n=1 Tax=Eptatretus burgeri TaxID=7764 RepID=A0A8C4QLI2_EPTBU